MRVYTARLGQYQGADLLDVTRKSATGPALAFAPSWAILRPALAARRAGDIEAAWPKYVDAYLAEMRQSYRAHREAWDLLLARPLVTLGCYCTDPARCHRTLLARDILTKLGADFRGERPRQQGALADRLMAAVDEEREVTR